MVSSFASMLAINRGLTGLKHEGLRSSKIACRYEIVLRSLALLPSAWCESDVNEGFHAAASSLFHSLDTSAHKTLPAGPLLVYDSH